MFKLLENVANAVADYTVGTLIVMAHIATADRPRRRLPAPR
jgi:hypothetical protein